MCVYVYEKIYVCVYLHVDVSTVASMGIRVQKHLRAIVYLCINDKIRFDTFINNIALHYKLCDSMQFIFFPYPSDLNKY